MSKKFDFTFDLSPKGVQQLVDNLQKYYREIVNCREDILDALTKRALELVKQNIKATTHGTGELESSIQVEKVSKEIAKVYTDLFYAQFVEYGTGVIGKNKPHKNISESGWSYDINEHGEEGWVYKDKSGQYFWTAGEEAHNFMYDTLVQLKEEYMTIARQVLKERGII